MVEVFCRRMSVQDTVRTKGKSIMIKLRLRWQITLGNMEDKVERPREGR